MRVYPPTTYGAPCAGSLYLDDGVSYDFKKGDYLRLQISCRLSTQGLIVTVAPRQGSFEPWWTLLSIEVYGATKPYASAGVTTFAHSAPVAVTTNFDAEHHRVTALVNDDAKGLQLQLSY